jgi:hypothetical protein
MKHLLLISCCLILALRVSHAQEENQDFFSAGINADAFAGLELAYWKSLNNGQLAPVCYAKFNFPLISSVKQKKIDTGEIKLGTQLKIYRRSQFLLLADAQLFALRHKQNLGRFIPMGFNVKLTPALSTQRGYFGLQLAYKQVLFTHIQHADYVKARFDDIYNASGELLQLAPKDGFFGFTGNQFNIGLEGRFQVGKRLHLYFDMGWIQFLSPYTQGMDAMMFGQVPFFLDLRLDCFLKSRS